MPDAATITISLEGLPEQTALAVARTAAERGPDRPLTHADVADIAAAAERLREAYSDTGTAAPAAAPAHAVMPRSIAIPGAILHTPTYAARLRLIEADGRCVPDAWAHEPSAWATLYCAFVLAHVKDRDTLAALADPGQAEVLVSAWGATLEATPAQANAAIAAIHDGAYPPSRPRPENEKKNASTPPHWRRPYSTWPPKPEEIRTTGSPEHPSPSSTGQSARSTNAAANRPRPCAATRPDQSPPTTPDAGQSKPGGNSSGGC